jgi:cytochrome c biogenesis protein CcmG, thiol:disulfide interchange protein DsbE
MTDIKPTSLPGAEAKVQKNRRLPAWVFASAFIVLLGFLMLLYWGLNRAQQGPITVGDQVPPFDLTTFDGQVIHTGDLVGKVVVVNFWASWCKPCEQEAAEMEQAWRLYEPSGQVVFLGVDYVDTEPEAMGYLNKFDITYPNGPDLRTDISQLFRIRGVPETYIIDRQGKLAVVKIGPFVSLPEIRDAIDGLL